MSGPHRETPILDEDLATVEIENFYCTKVVTNLCQRGTHFSKRTCDLKQNGTKQKAPFSGIVFRGVVVLFLVLSPETAF